jgi:hypothetical protein
MQERNGTMHYNLSFLLIFSLASPVGYGLLRNEPFSNVTEKRNSMHQYSDISIGPIIILYVYAFIMYPYLSHTLISYISY